MGLGAPECRARLAAVPGVVSFTENAGVVAWCPLAPAEVHYPTRLALGFRSGNWSLFFSIGGAAVYYPANERYCEPRPFRNVYVNQVTYVTRVTNVTNVYNVNNITVNHNTYLASARFVPSNARWQGGTQVQAQSFGGRAAYQPAPGGAQSIFARGQVIAGPATGRPVAGPQSVRVTAQSLTPTRSFQAPTQLPQQYVNRPVYRAALPSSVPHIQSLPQPGQRFTNASAAGSTPGTPRPGSGRTPVIGSGRTSENSNPSRPTGPGRPTDGTVSRPTNAGTGASKTGGSISSGLDAYLKEREAARKGGAGSPGGTTGNKPPTSGSRDNTTRGIDTTPTIPGRARSNGDSVTTPRTDTTRRPVDTTTPRTDTTRRPGENPVTPRTDPNAGAGSRAPGQSRSNADSYRPLHSGSPSGGSGKTDGGKSDAGKASRSPSDSKSTDKSKDNPPSKDHKNP
jgi:hypothetical protein